MSPSVTLDKVVFLDRDGVINHDSPDYIKSWEEFDFLPGSLEAIRLLTRQGFHLILITNQSILHRGMVPADVLHHIHERLRVAVEAAGGRIEDIFFCPHRPDENCDCRKPRPGLVLQARARHGIDLSRSIMIGDSATDILCGRRAGCGATVLVRTGKGVAAEQELAEQGVRPDAVAADLLEAARMILARAIFPDNG
jgi:D-glycero-D-manno-heptose 1,7-bisphosphate phosphatase